MGVISIAMPAVDRWYFSEILRGAAERINASGHVARMHRVPPADTATATATAAIQADFTDSESIGAIAAGFSYRPSGSTTPTAWTRPLVLIGGSALGFPTVMIDDVGAARIATEHLRGLGHTRIAHFTASDEAQSSHLILRRRVKGYRTAMESGGLEPVVVEHGLDPTSAYRAAHRVLQTPNRPTAVFAVSDDVAIAVLAAARDLDLRPGHDVSVIGINDQPGALEEELTTIRQQPADMGATAVDMLVAGLLPGVDRQQSRLHPSTLIRRSSTGPVHRA